MQTLLVLVLGFIFGGAANHLFAVRPLSREIEKLRQEVHASLLGLTGRVSFLEGERERRERTLRLSRGE